MDTKQILVEVVITAIITAIGTLNAHLRMKMKIRNKRIVVIVKMEHNKDMVNEAMGMVGKEAHVK